MLVIIQNSGVLALILVDLQQNLVNAACLLVKGWVRAEEILLPGFLQEPSLQFCLLVDVVFLMHFLEVLLFLHELLLGHHLLLGCLLALLLFGH